ncbi:hypothetical protein BWI93_16815 [Siphonobacter sp. BAB-5385]|uniref:hypothetical protein n=1 Tax=Siphonobacter sp. BAB-5385 TaxID=1864822 RepID=UPI000B9EB43C|nr:hypothetical protein [Siphonobacter sp. BAB-5385]OZI07050.1 hypothetical protein BWI93_16815 [Siphonobacter sp. BAB-5385]
MSFLFNKPRSVFSRCKAKFKRRLKPPEESVLKNSFKVIDCLDNYAIAKSSFTPQENQIMVNSMSVIQIGVYVANAASAHYVVEEDVDWLTTYGYNRRGIGNGDHPNAIKHAIRATLDTQVFGEVLARKLGTLMNSVLPYKL